MGRIVFIGSGFALCALVLLPMLQLGFIGDDVQGSWTRGYVAWWHVTVLQDVLTNIEGWVKNEGRFFPVSSAYALYFFSTPAAGTLEKPLQLVAVLINASTIYAIVRRLGTPGLALLSVLLFGSTLQIRFWYDPIVGSFILLPVAAECILLSCLLLLIANDRRSWKWACAAVVVEVIGLLTYEQTYAAFAAVGIASYILSTPGRSRTLGPTIVGLPIALLAALDVFLRSKVSFGAADPYSLHFVFGAYIATFLKQLIGALPLTYWLFKPIPPAIPNLSSIASFVDAGVISATILAFALAFACLRSNMMLAGRARLSLAFVGGTLWIVPAAIISLSPRWQAETMWGLAYVNVYLEYVGVALVASVIISAMLEGQQGGSRTTFGVRLSLSTLLAACVFVTATVNRASCAAFTPIYTNGRTNLDRALQNGLIGGIPTAATILFTDDSYIFPIPEIEYNVFQDTGKKIDPANVTGILAGQDCEDGKWTTTTCSAKGNVWEYRSTSSSIEHPWVQLMHVRLIARSASVQPVIVGDRWSVYTDRINGQHILDVGGTLSRAIDGDRGLYTYKSCAGLESVALVNTDFPYVSFLSGFYPTEHESVASEIHLFRWTLPEATMAIQKPPLPFAEGAVSMTLRSIGMERAMIRSGAHVVTSTTSPAGSEIKIPLVFGSADKALVELSVAGGPFRVSGDPRTLGLQVSNVRVDFACRETF